MSSAKGIFGSKGAGILDALGMEIPTDRKFVFITLDRGTPHTEVWRALYGLQAQQRASGKFIIAINDDIDPRNLDSVSSGQEMENRDTNVPGADGRRRRVHTATVRVRNAGS